MFTKYKLVLYFATALNKSFGMIFTIIFLYYVNIGKPVA